jgi:hypothetical protein
MRLRRRGMNSFGRGGNHTDEPGRHPFPSFRWVHEQDRLQIERVIREHKNEAAKEICNAILEHAVKQDAYLRQIGEEDRLGDKTVFVIKRR